MIQKLFDQNIIVYTFAGLCGLGLLIRLIVNILYKHLVKETDNLGTTKNKSLKHLKMKFETCYKLKIGVNNVDTFVDKNVLRYRFCGILLSTWENFCGQVLFLSLLLVPLCVIFGRVFNCGQNKILFSGSVGILASSILILVDKSINLIAKKRLIKLNLMDYLENFLKVRLEQESFHPELVEQYRQEYFKASTVDKQPGAEAAVIKEEPKDEVNKRREARKKKEEERKAQALKKEEEQKRIEEARIEEERRRLEEKKILAAKRRQEELQKIEEEKQALEARREQVKKKAEEKQLAAERKQKEKEEKEKLLHSIEEDLKASPEVSDTSTIIQGVEEIAAEKERTVKTNDTKVNQEVEQPVKAASGKSKGSGISKQEEKLIEDVLKEFFA